MWKLTEYYPFCWIFFWQKNGFLIKSFFYSKMLTFNGRFWDCIKNKSFWNLSRKAAVFTHGCFAISSHGIYRPVYLWSHPLVSTCSFDLLFSVSKNIVHQKVWWDWGIWLTGKNGNERDGSDTDKQKHFLGERWWPTSVQPQSCHMGLNCVLESEFNKTD